MRVILRRDGYNIEYNAIYLKSMKVIRNVGEMQYKVVKHPKVKAIMTSLHLSSVPYLLYDTLYSKVSTTCILKACSSSHGQWKNTYRQSQPLKEVAWLTFSI